jgi:threonine synthase
MHTKLQRNPRLCGLQCIRCEMSYPLTLLHSGCPACKAAGVWVSLRARYQSAATFAPALPYLNSDSLGEGATPLSNAPALASLLGLAQLRIKDESKNPTGSHKDRMSAMGVAQALDFGAHTVVLASSGNAAVSAARYAQAAGLKCEVAVYDGMPKPYVDQLNDYAAQKFSFANNEERWAFVADRAQRPGYFALTNYHLPALGSAPLAIEGYKAIAYECHASGCVPEHIMVPTARGDLAWGIYAGFYDLWLGDEITMLPKIWVVEPFARLSQALKDNRLHAINPGHTAQFSTAGATVTYLQWHAVTESQGGAVVVADAPARIARKLLAQHGYSAELCAAAGLAGAQQLRQSGLIGVQDQVMLVLTASAERDPSYPDPIDHSSF